MIISKDVNWGIISSKPNLLQFFHIAPHIHHLRIRDTKILGQQNYDDEHYDEDVDIVDTEAEGDDDHDDIDADDNDGDAD